MGLPKNICFKRRRRFSYCKVKWSATAAGFEWPPEHQQPQFMFLLFVLFYVSHQQSSLGLKSEARKATCQGSFVEKLTLKYLANRI